MWLPENFVEIIIRLVVAFVLGGLIGIERTGTRHDAGLRTHILVCLGATGVMIMSETMHLQFGGDVGRIGAQVVSGIGFLGAGCILVNGNRIKGLTTAAGLWTTACVGLAVGLGYYFVAVLTVALVLLAMLVLHPITARLQKKGQRADFTIKVYTDDRHSFKSVSDYMTEQEHKIVSMSVEEDGALLVKLSDDTAENINHLVCSLMENEGIKRIERL